MVDLTGTDKGNISLPVALQSYDEEESRNEPTILNLQRAFYNLKIADIENRIHRLDDLNDELLERIEATNELSVTIDTETAAEIANLTKLISSQDSRLKNLTNQINQIKLAQIEGKQAQNDEEAIFIQKYMAKKIELVSQMKSLNAKINTLEDFRKLQKALQEKLKTNNTLMEEKDKTLDEILQDINLRFRFDKEIIKDEMYKGLLNLVARFQVEINKYINLPSQRLLRENVLLKNELWQIQEEISDKEGAKIDFKYSTIRHKKNILEQMSDIQKNTVIVKVEDELFNSLNKKFKCTREFLSVIKIPDPSIEEHWLLSIDNIKQKEEETQFFVSKLQVLLHKEKTKINIVKYLQRKTDCKIKVLIAMLYELKYLVMCMLQIPGSSPDMSQMSYDNVVSLLQRTFRKGETKFRCNTIDSVESIPKGPELCIEELEKLSSHLDLTTLAELIEPKSSHIVTPMVIIPEDIYKEETKDVDTGKEVSTESSYLEEAFEETLFSDDDLEGEFMENESLFEANEE